MYPTYALLTTSSLLWLCCHLATATPMFSSFHKRLGSLSLNQASSSGNPDLTVPLLAGYSREESDSSSSSDSDTDDEDKDYNVPNPPFVLMAVDKLHKEPVGFPWPNMRKLDFKNFDTLHVGALEGLRASGGLSTDQKHAMAALKARFDLLASGAKLTGEEEERFFRFLDGDSDAHRAFHGAAMNLHNLHRTSLVLDKQAMQRTGKCRNFSRWTHPSRIPKSYDDDLVKDTSAPRLIRKKGSAVKLRQFNSSRLRHHKHDLMNCLCEGRDNLSLMYAEGPSRVIG